MSNEQKDWEADLEHETNDELVKLVKHFQGVALGTYKPEEAKQLHYINKAALLIQSGGHIEVRKAGSEWEWVHIELADFIIRCSKSYDEDNVRFILLSAPTIFKEYFR